MGDNVLQIAAGLYPNSTAWQAYAWLIRNAQSNQVYNWVINGSVPEMSPSSQVELSIFLSPPGWQYQLADISTGATTHGSFGLSTGPVPRSGDQEVFSLESYSSSGSTFQGMGNMTLESVFVNGDRITGGGYFYGSWDPAHSPLFVVGSGNPPPFVSVERLQNSSAVWSYERAWTGNVSISAPSTVAEGTVAALLVASLAVLAFFVIRQRRSPPRDTTATPEAPLPP
jgi:hypothetical protein